MPDNAFFICLEGGEGTGKTTQAKRLVGSFEAQQKEAIYTKEPGGTPVADRIRSVLLYSEDEQVNPRAELLLFLASRAQHVSQLVQPSVEKGTTIICDRFSGSTFAYQIAGRGIKDSEFVKQMDAYARYGYWPDLTVYLDIDPEIGLARKQAQMAEELTRFDQEELEFHNKVRAAFKEMSAKDPTWVVIDASKTLEEVSDDLKAVVAERLQITL